MLSTVAENAGGVVTVIGAHVVVYAIFAASTLVVIVTIIMSTYTHAIIDETRSAMFYLLVFLFIGMTLIDIVVTSCCIIVVFTCIHESMCRCLQVGP